MPARPAPAWTDEGAPVVPHRLGIVPRREIAAALAMDARSRALDKLAEGEDEPAHFAGVHCGDLMAGLEDDNQGLRGWGVVLLLAGAGVGFIALAVLVSFVWQP